MSRTARILGIDLQIVDVRGPADFEAAFASMRAGGADSVNILASPILSGSQDQLGALSLQYRIPAICQFREMAEAGCLASYGITRSELFALLAGSIDKVLKGARPSDTPVQQPTNFELVINRRVARALGVEIPHAVLARADVIEQRMPPLTYGFSNTVTTRRPKQERWSRRCDVVAMPTAPTYGCGSSWRSARWARRRRTRGIEAIEPSRPTRC